MLGFATPGTSGWDKISAKSTIFLLPLREKVPQRGG